MSKLTDLVIEYRKTKSDAVFNQVYAILQNKIKEKAKVLFYKPIIVGEKEIEVFDRKTKQYVKGKKKKYIKLCESAQVDLNDVIQELNLKLLQLINEYDSQTGTFETYYFATFWNYVPEFINQEFLDQLKNVKTYKLNEEGDEESIVNNIAVFTDIQEDIDLRDLFEYLSPQEIDVLNVLIKNPSYNQSQVAEKVGVKQRRVCDIYKSLRNKVLK